MTVLYKPGDVMKRLNLKESVFKKYYLALEKEGYTIQKDERGHRLFTDQDIETLEEFINLIQFDGMTIEKVAKRIGKINGHNDVADQKENSHDIMTLLEKQESKYHAVITEILNQNNELKEQLKRLENSHDDYLKKLESSHDEHLKRLENKHDELFMQSIRESQERKQIELENKERLLGIERQISEMAASREKKGSWLSRLFNK